MAWEQPEKPPVYNIPRHWEEDRLVTWEEFANPHGISCIDCGTPLTNFEQCASRLSDESATEISFSEEDVIPIKELICTECEAKGLAQENDGG